MIRIICLITTLCLVLGSFSFCFATPTSWDTNDQQKLSNISSYTYDIKTTLTSLSSTVSTISSNINTIKGYLFSDGHSVAYWAAAIDTFMQPILNAILSIPESSEELQKALTNYAINITGTIPTSDARATAHQYILGDAGGGYYSYYYSMPVLNDNMTGGSAGTYWNRGTPLGNIAWILINSQRSVIRSNIAMLQGYSATQTAINWGNNQSSTFTPVSAIDGLYKYLSAIQAPAARLSYVLASDADIEARENAAPNQQAVVDNFIDSSGAGSASPSDIGSLSDLSSGYQDNFGSDASVTGIFNIFNSNNMGWFSQETANQLDTTSPTRRGSSFDTPLLDQQINDIYDQIGVKHD